MTNRLDDRFGIEAGLHTLDAGCAVKQAGGRVG